MDHANTLLAALRAAQHLAGAPLTASRVEELAKALGLPIETLPERIAELQRKSAVALVWGGGVEVLPEKPSITAGHVVNAAAGAVVTFAGRDAIMSNVGTEPSPAIGDLVAVLVELRKLQPSLAGDAAHVAQVAEAALSEFVAAETPAARRPKLVQSAFTALRGLLTYAPEVKDLSDVVRNFLPS